jgi:hypothetical protein
VRLGVLLAEHIHERDAGWAFGAGGWEDACAS